MNIKQFAECNINDQSKYAILADGSKIVIDEKQIDKIWWVWLSAKGSSKRSEGTFIIFEFGEPTEVNI